MPITLLKTKINHLIEKVKAHEKEPESVRTHRLFVVYPMWKTILIMLAPAIAISFFYSIFAFLLLLAGVQWGASNLAIHSSQTLNDAEKITRSAIGGYASPILLFTQALAFLFSRGVATRYAFSLGEKNIKQAQSTAGNGILSCLTVTAMFTIIMHFVAPAWINFEAGGENDLNTQMAINLSHDYAKWIVYSTILVGINSLLINLLRTEGKGKLSTMVVFSMIVVTIVASYLLMGVGHMDSSAAGLAFFISYAYELVALLAIITFHKKTYIRWSMWRYFRFDYRMILLCMAIGLAPFFRQFSLSLTATLFQEAISNLSGKLGEGNINQTHFADALPIMTLLVTTVFGFVQAGSPISSYNYGANNYLRVRKTITWILWTAVIYNIILYVLLNFALGKPLMMALKIDSEEIKNALPIMWIISSGLLVISPWLAAMTYYQSTQRPIISFILSILRSVVFFIPLVYIFQAITSNIIAGGTHSMMVFWFTYPVTWVLTSIASAVILWLGLRHLNWIATQRSGFTNWFSNYEQYQHIRKTKFQKLAGASALDDTVS